MEAEEEKIFWTVGYPLVDCKGVVYHVNTALAAFFQKLDPQLAQWGVDDDKGIKIWTYMNDDIAINMDSSGFLMWHRRDGGHQHVGCRPIPGMNKAIKRNYVEPEDFAKKVETIFTELNHK